MSEGEAPRLLEGIADGLDAGLLGGFEQRPADCGEEMCVLVGIEVRDVEACCLELADLCEGFGSDVGCAQLTTHDCEDEGEERGAEVYVVGADKRGNGGGGRGGSAVGEDDVAADAERRVALRDANGVVEGRACGHEGGGAEDAGAIKVFDSPINAWSKAEVVRVDDEAGWHEGEEMRAWSDGRWWAVRDSNPRHPACKAGALTN